MFGLIHGFAHVASSGIGAVDGAAQSVVQVAGTGIGALDGAGALAAQYVGHFAYTMIGATPVNSAGSAVLHSMETAVEAGVQDVGWVAGVLYQIGRVEYFGFANGIMFRSLFPGQLGAGPPVVVQVTGPEPTAVPGPATEVEPAADSGPEPTAASGPVSTTLSRSSSEKSGLGVNGKGKGSARRGPEIWAEALTVGHESAELVSGISKLQADFKARNPWALRTDGLEVWDTAKSLGQDLPHLVQHVIPAFGVQTSHVSKACAHAETSASSTDARNMPAGACSTSASSSSEA